MKPVRLAVAFDSPEEQALRAERVKRDRVLVESLKQRLRRLYDEDRALFVQALHEFVADPLAVAP